MAKFAGIDIRIGADTSRLSRDMKKADGIVGKFSTAAANAMKTVAVGATVAAVKIGVDGVKAYIDDENAARKLAVTLENVTKATAEQTAGVEDYITKTMFATGVADDELRPAFARLIRSTNDITKAQKLLNLGLDISAGTGKSLDSVVAALGKSYDGSNTSLGRLGLGIDAAKLKNGKFNDITKELRKNFQGFAEEDANTMEGKLKRLNLRWQESKEQIGGVLLEGLEPLMDWFQTAEGEEAIQGFMVGLQETFKAVAELIPLVIDGLKKLGGMAAGLNINFEDIMSPEMLAAAAAFRVAMPLGLPAATLAGVTAWAVAHDNLNPAKNPAGTQGVKDLDVNSLFENGVYKTGAKKSPIDVAGLYGTDYSGMGFTGTSVALPQSSTINITINGAVDPMGTSVAVQKAINKAARMGIKAKIQGMGLGNG